MTNPPPDQLDTAPDATAPEASSTPVRPHTDAAPPPPSVAPAADGPRRWWRRPRRPWQPTPSDAERELGRVPVDAGPTSLLNRSPFQIGFQLALGALVAFALVSAVATLQWVLILGVLSLFVALGLNPLVEKLREMGAPRGLAVAAVALSLVVIVGLGAWAVLPLLTEQVNNLVLNTPGWLQGLRENEQVAELDQQFDIINRVSQVLTSGAWVEGLFGGLLGAGMAIANVVVSAIVTLVLTLWFLASLPAIKSTLYQLAPASRRPRVRYLANEMFQRIGGYMSGLFIVVVLASGSAFLFLNVIGLGQFSLALAVVVAGFAFIPLVGPTISMLMVSLVAFTHSITAGIATLIFFLVYQQIDAYVLQPRIFQRSVNVPGPLVVLAALSGGILFGIAGALLAIPTVAVLLLLYREVLQPALDRA